MKPKKCSNPRCIHCRWWKKVSKYVGVQQGCYWIDEYTGEVFVATGLRATPAGDAIEINDEEGFAFYETECNCGDTVVIRADLIDRGLSGRCMTCAASTAEITRN